MLAVVLGYVFANAALHRERALEWRALDECLAATGLWAESTEAFQACGHHVNIADGAAIVFYLYLGWIPAAGYTGFHELVWRWRHRAAIQGMGSVFKGRLASNVVIAVFLLCLAGAAFLLGSAFLA